MTARFSPATVPALAITARVVGGALLAALAAAGPLSAQEDFRSLDAGRPLRTTDAYPKKFLEWEIQAGARGEVAEDGRRGTASLALEVGALPNFELGLGLEPGFEDPDGEAGGWGVEEVGLHALYNFNQEGWSWPAVALEAGLEAPVGGDLSREEWGVSGGLLATRSFASRLRIHANGGFTVQTDPDGGDFWTGGLALDAPLGLSSRVVMADVFVEVPVDAGPTRTWAEVGARFQVSNWTVLDLGLGTRLDRWADGRTNVELTLGLSRVFGVRAFTPSPPYSEPSIR